MRKYYDMNGNEIELHNLLQGPDGRYDVHVVYYDNDRMDLAIMAGRGSHHAYHSLSLLNLNKYKIMTGKEILEYLGYTYKDLG